MSYLYVLEAANLHVGDNPPDNDKSLIIESAKLPDLEELVAAFHPLGRYGALEIGGLGLKELQIEFKTAGYDPQTMSRFGLFGQLPDYYTIYGALRNKQDNALSQLKAIAHGRLKKATPDSYKRGDLFGTSFSISQISHYELYLDGAEQLFYDFYANRWRVNGDAKGMGDINACLGINA